MTGVKELNDYLVSVSHITTTDCPDVCVPDHYIRKALVHQLAEAIRTRETVERPLQHCIEHQVSVYVIPPDVLWEVIQTEAMKAMGCTTLGRFSVCPPVVERDEGSGTDD